MHNEIRVAVDKCQPNPGSLRGVDRDEEDYQEFASSIRARGVLQPILLRPIPAANQIEGGPEYYIIDGLQRWSASKDAGFLDIPVRIQDMSDKEVRDSQIIANVHRVETKPKEYAQALMNILKDDPMMTKQQLAAQLNKSTSWLDQRLSLTKLEDDVGELVDTGKISLNNAIILAKLSVEDQKAFAQEAMTKDSGTFGAAVQTHLKEQRKAKAEGRPVGPVEYVPGPVLLKLAQVEEFATNTNNVSVFLKEQGVKATADTVLAAQTAFQKCLQLDPLSVKSRKEQHEADKIEREKQNAIRKEEKEKQKLADASATRQRLEQELAGV